MAGVNSGSSLRGHIKDEEVANGFQVQIFIKLYNQLGIVNILFRPRYKARAVHREDGPWNIETTYQPIWRPLFCFSSHFWRGAKYSAMARVLSSSPVASFSSLRQSSVAPFFSQLSRYWPTSLWPA